MNLRNRRTQPSILASSIATLAVSLLLATASHAQAASASWLAAPVDGNWEPAVGPNWSSGTNTFPGATSGNASTDVATFNVTSSITTIVINNGAPPDLNISGITFTGAASNYTIGSTSGEALFLTSGGTIQIDSSLTATGALEEVAAPLIIGGSTYSLLNNSANGAGAGAGTLAFVGAISDSGVGAATLTLAGSNTNSNLVLSVISDGGSALSVVKDGAGTWNIHGFLNNTYTGTTTINDGTLDVSGSAAQQLGTGAVTIGDGTGAPGSAVLENGFNNVFADTQAFTLNSDGAYKLQGLTETVGSITSSSTTSTVDLGGGNLTTGDATNTTYAGTIVGAGSLTKQGSGTWTLSGTNTYTAATNITAGTLAAGSTGGLSPNSAFTISATGTLDLAGFNSTIGSLAGSGPVTSSAGLPNFTIGNDGTSTSYSGNISNIAALIKIGGGTQTFVGTHVTGPGVNQFTVDGGTMALTAGSQVGVFGGGTVVGSTAGTNGNLFVDASTLTSLFLAVGQHGTGTLTLQNGGSAGASNIFIGQFADGIGTLTVTGAGSNIPLASTFNVGDAGKGTANVVNGGNINATNINIGAQSGATGLLNIDAGSVTASGIVNVASAGATGTLRLANGGVLNAPTVNVVAGGAVEVSGAYTLNTPAANLTFDGGILRATGTATFTNAATIGQNGIVLDSAGATGTLSGILTGAGSLTKTGTGKWIVNGAQQYTGNTIINGGDLAVEGSIQSPQVMVNLLGTLSGSGTILGSVTNHGLVAPGNSPGTLTINGSYTQGSDGILGIEIASLQSYDRLSIQGHATIAGTLAVTFDGSFKPKRGDTFTFLTAGGGVSGTFSHILGTQKFGMLNFDVEQRGNSLLLVAESASIFQTLGSVLTPNQRAVGAALDSAQLDPRMAKVFDYLANRSASQIPGDLDHISHEELTSIYTIGLAYATVQAQNFQRRTDDIRTGSAGFSAAGLSMNGAGPSYSGGLGVTTTGVAGPSGTDGKASKQVEQTAPVDNRWGAFLSGTGEWVNVSGTDNARGYNLNSGGFTLGVDYKLTPNLAVGIAAGYTGTTADLTDHGRVWENGGKVGLYATTFAGGWYADVAAFGGYNSFDTRRSALQGEARGDSDGGEVDALFGTGYDFKAGALTFGPTASFNYTYIGTNGFTEHGSLLPLDVHSGQSQSLRSAFGVKASYDWKVGGVVIKPELRAAWQHEYGDSTSDLGANFANGAGNSFVVGGPTLGRDSLLLGAGFAIQLTERTTTYFYYDGELARKNYQSNSVTGGLRVAF